LLPQTNQGTDEELQDINLGFDSTEIATQIEKKRARTELQQRRQEYEANRLKGLRILKS
jgi:hypothetical protein